MIELHSFEEGAETNSYSHPFKSIFAMLCRLLDVQIRASVVVSNDRHSLLLTRTPLVVNVLNQDGYRDIDVFGVMDRI